MRHNRTVQGVDTRSVRAAASEMRDRSHALFEREAGLYVCTEDTYKDRGTSGAGGGWAHIKAPHKNRAALINNPLQLATACRAGRYEEVAGKDG